MRKLLTKRTHIIGYQEQTGASVMEWYPAKTKTAAVQSQDGDWLYA
jgi:hypothetical protein